MPDLTRLGAAPMDRPGVLRSASGATCPDVLLAGDRVYVIGRHLQGGDLLDLPPGSGVGEGETVVEIPLLVFRDAARDLMAQPDLLLAISESEGCSGRGEETVPNTSAQPAVGTVLTSADPEPPVGTLVTDDCGGTWVNSGEYLHWVRIDRGDDPESWAKIAGNYGPVTIKSWSDDD